MSLISFQHVTKAFGDASETLRGRAAVWDVTLDVEEGEFVVLLGPSGCGKTTLMRMVNRLIEPTSGEIFLGGREVHQIAVTELRRHIGYVIQQVGLFPHMTVAQNVAVVPRLLGWQRDRIHARTDELLDLVDLAPDRYRGRYPRQLSGGQQQRVGIARAMAADPAVMLMDEPFGAIDAITRTDLQNELLNIQRKVGKTVIFVTHDVDEALRLASRIAVMRAGEVVQYDTPFRLLTEPATPFVFELLGGQDIFRQLSLVPVSQVMERGSGSANALRIGEEESLRAALSLLIVHGGDELSVIGHDGALLGHVTLHRILSEGARGNAVPS